MRLKESLRTSKQYSLIYKRQPVPKSTGCRIYTRLENHVRIGYDRMESFTIEVFGVSHVIIWAGYQDEVAAPGAQGFDGARKIAKLIRLNGW